MEGFWLNRLNENPIPWLLEEDLENPGVRYFVLTELQELPSDDPQVRAARQAVMSSGPVPVILGNQDLEGFWVEPGPGYYPKYRGTVWQLVCLSQLGADHNHPAVRAACEYVLEHSRCKFGGFSADSRPSGMIQCLQGNLAAALIDLGWFGDERLAEALDWLARSITGQGIAPAEEKKAPVRYYRSGNSGSGFLCSANDHLPCAWGAVKAILGLSKVPEAEHTKVMREAIEVGKSFLLGHDPAVANYPMGYSSKPNLSWFRFGYPMVGYVTDVLQNLEVLTALGLGNDPRIQAALDLVLSKQDDQGRWKIAYTYNGKIWADVEDKKLPIKWVTFRALRVLKCASEQQR